MIIIYVIFVCVRGCVCEVLCERETLCATSFFLVSEMPRAFRAEQGYPSHKVSMHPVAR